MSGHLRVNPPELPPAVGFSHAVLASPGRLVFLAGQAGAGPDGEVVSEDLVEQFDRAVANLTRALEAAGGRPEHLVWLQIFTTDPEGYRRSRKPIGQAYRRRMGRRYPAVGLFGVSALFDPRARVELMGLAVIPAEAEEP